MRQCVLAVWFTTLLACQSIAAQTKYFPHGCLDKDPRVSEYIEQWYSKSLLLLKEPSLWELRENQDRHSYRFLWLRSFDPPIAVRLDVNQDGTGLLTTKISNGKGGFETGSLVVYRTRKLMKREINWFLDRIQELGFWNLSAHDKPEERFGCDGAQWIVEGVRAGEYKVVDRWSPEKGPVRKLGLLMVIHLAKLKLPSQKIY